MIDPDKEKAALPARETRFAASNLQIVADPNLKGKSARTVRKISKAALLRAALLDLLTEHEREGTLPTSARFLFYELVMREVISKHAEGKRRPDQDMSVALTQLREGGEIPWNWIVDETRSLESYCGSESVKQWMRDRLSIAKLDPWDGSVPLILAESRSLAGVLRSLCSEYRVQIAPTNGQVGGFLRTDVAPILYPGAPILYLGDWDLAGGLIEANTRRVLEREVGELQWERLALTAAQVEQYNLPRIIKQDRRYKDGRPHEAVETEALSQRVIVEILRRRLDELLPAPLESVQEREEQERAQLARYLEEAP